MFETLPKVFEQMPLGRIIGLVFFVLVFLAALTSSISIMEAIASIVMDKFKISRVKAVLIIFAISVILGIPSAFSDFTLVFFSLWSAVTNAHKTVYPGHEAQ